MAAVVGSWGYFCMGTVRGWGSPGLPSLNKTLDFDMNEDDFKWICKLKIFHLTGNSFNFSKFTYSCNAHVFFLLWSSDNQHTDAIPRPEESFNWTLFFLHIRFSHPRTHLFRQAQSYALCGPIAARIRRWMYNSRLSNLRNNIYFIHSFPYKICE